MVLVLVEERSAARQQNFVRSPQIAMRPFSTVNAAHTRRKFSTIVKIFAKSEQDPNSKLVALVFSLLQTDETLVNFCQLYFFGSCSCPLWTAKFVQLVQPDWSSCCICVCLLKTQRRVTVSASALTADVVSLLAEQRLGRLPGGAQQHVRGAHQAVLVARGRQDTRAHRVGGFGRLKNFTFCSKFAKRYTT